METQIIKRNKHGVVTNNYISYIGIDLLCYMIIISKDFVWLDIVALMMTCRTVYTMLTADNVKTWLFKQVPRLFVSAYSTYMYVRKALERPVVLGLKEKRVGKRNTENIQDQKQIAIYLRQCNAKGRLEYRYIDVTYERKSYGAYQKENIQFEDIITIEESTRERCFWGTPRSKQRVSFSRVYITSWDFSFTDQFPDRLWRKVYQYLDEIYSSRGFFIGTTLSNDLATTSEREHVLDLDQMIPDKWWETTPPANEKALNLFRHGKGCPHEHITTAVYTMPETKDRVFYYIKWCSGKCGLDSDDDGPITSAHMEISPHNLKLTNDSYIHHPYLKSIASSFNVKQL